MCATCGCGNTTAAGKSKAHLLTREGRGGRIVRLEADLMAHNSQCAARNRSRWQSSNTHVINLMSSPGSGKTTLLVRTLEALRSEVAMAVVEGDQQTNLDADRIAATGIPAWQINTGKGCHLDAEMVAQAVNQLAAPAHGILFIENVGNLVCPAGFDLGENRKVVMVSVTEGEDKPLKYPDMFAVAHTVVVNKMDLAPYAGVDVAALDANIQRVNPGVPVVHVSARTGEGMAAWLAWLCAPLANAGAHSKPQEASP